jgi:hypothetical protein
MAVGWRSARRGSPVVPPNWGLSVYFRYTLSNGKRDTLSIGTYDETGRDGLTLARARDRAGELSKRLMGPTV